MACLPGLATDLTWALHTASSVCRSCCMLMHFLPFWCSAAQVRMALALALAQSLKNPLKSPIGLHSVDPGLGIILTASCLSVGGGEIPEHFS